MHRQKFNYLYVLVILCLVSSVNAMPSATELATLINLSGKQRMLTQKMSKEVAMVYLGYDSKATIKTLKSTSQLFDKTLNALQSGDESLGLVAIDNRRIQRQLNKVVSLWQPFKKRIDNIIKTVEGSSKPEQVDLSYVVDNNAELLKEMNRAVRLYENFAEKNESDKSMATTINLAGKQRMLTQKMSKDFFLIKLGFQKEKHQKDLRLASDLFERTLKGLEHGDATLGLTGTRIEAANNQLNKVDALWQPMKIIFSKASTNASLSDEDIDFIAKQNVPLLKEMNVAVKLYEKELK